MDFDSRETPKTWGAHGPTRDPHTQHDGTTTSKSKHGLTRSLPRPAAAPCQSLRVFQRLGRDARLDGAMLG
jgi:hypothetical protein